MFTLDWSDPRTFWLNVTNVVLISVTLICVAVVAYGVMRELWLRMRRRLPILMRETGDAHALDMPELGLTMADGGEPLARTREPQQRPKRAR
jgi:hypothetical protein